MPRAERLRGLGVAEGIAIGKAVCISTRIVDIFRIPLSDEDVEPEAERFREAVQRSREEIHRLRERVGEEVGDDVAAIFDAQALFLSDSYFLDRVLQRIREEKVNAEWALHEAAAELQGRFDAIDTLHLRERSEDLRDVCRYLLRRLQGLPHHEPAEFVEDIVIVADDITPSEAVRLGRQGVVGFAIEHGGRTSHTTIIARSLNLPAVTGVAGITQHFTEQAEVPIIVDGHTGLVLLNPEPGVVKAYRRRKSLQQQEEEQERLSTSALEAMTLDGTRIALMANIDLPEEIEDALRYGATGIGLYRSEFLYIEKSPELPTEDEHLALYRRLIEAAAPHPAIIRTYDLGGRKIAREVMHTEEANPVLGLRGIRLTLARPEIFKTQIRALLRASVYGDLWIMLPLVTIVEEVRAFRRVAQEAMVELDREGLVYGRSFRLGVMIEVPAAAEISDLFAREVDFFSIGTNDLIQYALAVDRNNDHVAGLYQPLHPAILRMLLRIADNAQQAGIEVSLCGEMAADPRLVPVLLGCGLRRLSVSPRQLAAIKRRICSLRIDKLREIVEASSRLPTSDEVEHYLRTRLEDDAAVLSV